LTTSEATTTEAPKAKRARKRRGRRLNGEGTIFQRSDGRWCASLSFGARRKYVYAATAEAVRAKLNAAIEAKTKGAPIDDGRISVADHLETFLTERRSRTRPQTMQHYENAVTRHIVPALGHVKLRKLTPAMVLAFLETKRAEVIGKRADGSPRTLSPMMVRHIRTVLKMALELAVDLELVARNPVRKMKSGRAERSKVNPLDDEETRKFLKTAIAHPLGALWLVVATLGLRRGEVLGLRWADVDLERGMVSVRVQLLHLKDADGKQQPSLVEPKSKNALRDLRLAPAVVDALKKRKAEQAAQRLQLGEAWGPDLGLVFTTQDGRPLMGGAVSSTHAVLCKKAGVRRVRFHDLRHGAASLMLAAGVDPRTLSETLGHSRVGFTLDTYAHVKRPKLDDAVDKLAAVLLPNG
jgi:integrase